MDECENCQKTESLLDDIHSLIESLESTLLLKNAEEMKRSAEVFYNNIKHYNDRFMKIKYNYSALISKSGKK